jgi:hypothetical protein
MVTAPWRFLTAELLRIRIATIEAAFRQFTGLDGGRARYNPDTDAWYVEIYRGPNEWPLTWEVTLNGFVEI